MKSNMRKVILLWTMLLSFPVYAQRVDKPGEMYNIYCIFTIGLYGKDSYSSVEMCNERLYLLNEKNEELRFVSYADGITYMTKRGWEYVDRINPGVFLLRKAVNRDDQAKEFLNIEVPKNNSSD